MAVKLRTTPASEAWRSVMTVSHRVNRVLADEMADETEVSLDWYGILLMLTQAESGALRASDIADQLGMSRSGTTRLVDRLEGEGLVERRACGTDRRGTFVALTVKGEETFRRAGRIHLRGIEEHVGAHLTKTELRHLTALLDKLAASVDEAAMTFVPIGADRS